jgi:hypothetical protein
MMTVRRDWEAQDRRPEGKEDDEEEAEVERVNG